MSTREEAAAGFQLLTAILNKSGLRLRRSDRPWQDLALTYIEFGTDDRSTAIALSDEFLSDLPSTREYQAEAESYAAIVAGRMKCGPPNAFYCRSGIPINLEIHWPMSSGLTQDGRHVNWLLVAAENELDETVARCSLAFDAFEFPGQTPFQRAEQIANRIRDAVDERIAQFAPREPPSSRSRVIEQKRHGERPAASQGEVENFLLGKVYHLGFRAAHSPRPIWIPDPWDASYLGTTPRMLSQAAHILQAKKRLTISDGYAIASDTLLTDGPGEPIEGPRRRQILSLSTLPNKAIFETHIADELKRRTELALIFVDLDHFKEVNDTHGHQAGDACLEKAIQAMGDAIGSKGTLYRWGGDEFAVCLPDFSTAEATATAERLRHSIKHSRAGADVIVTASIGVGATDQSPTTSAAEFIDAVDKAMYASKEAGRNRVTVVYKTGLEIIDRRRRL